MLGRIRRSVVAAGLLPLGFGCLHHDKGAGWSLTAPLPQNPPATGPSAATAAATEDLPDKQQAALNMTMAENCAKEGKETDAIEYYEKARTQDPSLNEKVSRRLAVLYDRHDEQALAMKEFEELLKKRPKDSNLLNDMGYSHYNRGQWVEAESYLRRAVAADKANKRAWNNLGFALAMQGKYAEAIETFHKSVSQAEAQANIGFVLVVQGKPAEAAGAYRRALELEPTLKTAQAALARLEGGSDPKTETAYPVSPAAGFAPNNGQ